MHSKTFSVVTCLLVNVIVAKPLFEGGFMMTDPSNLEAIAKKQTMESDRSKTDEMNLPEVKESDKTEEAFSQVPHSRPRMSSGAEQEDSSKEASRELNSKDKLEDQSQKLAKRADVVDNDNLKPKRSPPKPKSTNDEPVSSGSAVEKAPEDIKSSTVPVKDEVSGGDKTLTTGTTESKASKTFTTQPDDASKVKSSISSTDPQDAPKENKNGWFDFFKLFQPKPANDVSSKPRDSVNNDLRPITDKETKAEDTEKFKETINERPLTASEPVKENASVNANKQKRPEVPKAPKVPKDADAPRKTNPKNELNSDDIDSSRDSENSNPRTFTEPREDSTFADEEFDDQPRD